MQVVTLNNNQSLHHYKCAGIVDGDDYSTEEKIHFSSLNIHALSVSEIENIFLLEDVLTKIAETNEYKGSELTDKITELKSEFFEHASIDKNQQESLLRYARRRIDRTLKKIDCSEAKNEDALIKIYETKTKELDIRNLIHTAREAIKNATEKQDINELLQWYDNKGLLVIPSKTKNMKVEEFKLWIVRHLHNKPDSILSQTIRKHLPNINSDRII